MGGANYMGGRRNIARARAKDVTGRKQKGHFMKQKHQILARGLRENPNDDGEPPSIRPGRLEQIGFAHARKDLQTDPGKPNAKSSLEYNALTKNPLLPSSSPGSVKRSQVRKSKLLESLDINDPSALRATVRRILAQSDLAGLSGRPLPWKDRARLETAIDNPRKKQKKVGSTSSSSSFRYESPTRKATFNKTLFPAKKGLARLPTDTMIGQRLATISPRSHSSLTLDRGTSVGNSSFDSSLDRLSAMQEAGSVLSFPDPGFSELHFTDDSELWHEKNGSYWSDGSVQWTNEQEPQSVKVGPSSDSPLGSLSIKFNTEESGHPRKLDLPGYSFELQGVVSSSYPTTPPPSKDRNNPALYSDYVDHWFDLDEITNSQPLLEDASERAADLEDDGRYGVGYVPTDSSIRYKPYVPLATMLPSYSDDTEADLDGSDAARDVEKSVAMDIDFECVNYSVNDEEQSTVLEQESLNFPSPSPDIHRKAPSETQSQSIASSVSYDSQPNNRLQSLFPPGDSLRSTFSAQRDEDEDLHCSRSTTLLPRNQISPSHSYSKSTMASGAFWTPDEATRNCLSDVEGLHSRSTNSPPYQGHINSLPTPDTSSPGHPNAYQAIDLDRHQEDAQPFRYASEEVPNPQFFDGPDLFAGDEGDDDDD